MFLMFPKDDYRVNYFYTNEKYISYSMSYTQKEHLPRALKDTRTQA